MIEVSDAIRGEQCTECDRFTDADTPAVYITGYAYGSSRFELILCESCATDFASHITDEVERQLLGEGDE